MDGAVFPATGPPGAPPPLAALLAGQRGAASEKCLDRVAACLGAPTRLAPLLSAHRVLHASPLPVFRAPAAWRAEGPRGARAVVSALAGGRLSPRWAARIDVASITVRTLVLGVDDYKDRGKAAWVTDAVLRFVGESGHFAGLSSLHLGCCDQVTDAGVAALAERCPQLSSLNLSYCDKVTDAGVAALSSLSSLNITSAATC